MANKPLNTAILDRAIIFAVRAHTGTERRGKGFPYIVHPMEAAIDRLARASHDAKIVALGDKLWSRFHAKDPKDHAWHYRGLAASLSELSEATGCLKSYRQPVAQFINTALAELR